MTIAIDYIGSQSITVSTTAAQYCGLFAGGLDKDTTETKVQCPYRQGMTFSKFSCEITANATTATSTINLRKNAASVNQVLSIGAGLTGKFIDNSHTDTIVSSDKMAIKIVAGSNNNLTIRYFSIVTDTNDTRYGFGMGGQLTTGLQTTYHPIAGHANTPNSSTTEANVKVTFRTSGTAKNAWVAVRTSGAGDSAATFRLRKNGANGNLTISIPGSGGTGIYEDTTHTDTISSGDTLNYSITTGSIVGLTCSMGISYVPTDHVNPWIGGSDTGNSITAGTAYFILNGAAQFSVTETDENTTLVGNYQVSHLFAYISANAGSGDISVTLRQNSTDTGLVLSIVHGTTGYFENTDDIVFLESGDEADYKVVGNTGASFTEILLGSHALWGALSADFSCTGSTTATATGVASKTATGSSMGVAASSVVGNATSKSPFSSSGTSTVSGVSFSTQLAVGASTGVAASSVVGNSTATATAASSGVAASSVVGNSTATATAASSGVAASSVVGTGLNATVGSASSTSIVLTQSNSGTFAAGDASGVAASSVVGSATATATAASTGVASDSVVGSATAMATAASTGVAASSVAGTGLIMGVAAADGSSTVLGTLMAFFSAIGSALGLSEAIGGDIETAEAEGSSTGLTTVSGSSNAIAEGFGNSVGSMSSNIIGTGVSYAAFTGTARGRAYGREISGDIGTGSPFPVEQVQDSKKLQADAYVELFQIRLADNATVIYLKLNSTMTWQGNEYEGTAIKITGVASYADTTASRPQLQVLNPEGVYSFLVDQGLLDNATIVRIRVLKEHLDDDLPIYRREQWRVSRIAQLTGQYITMELRDMLDGAMFVTPSRMFIPPDFPIVSLQ